MMQCADANECIEKEKKEYLLEMRACGSLSRSFLCENAQTKDTQHGKGVGATRGAASHCAVREGATMPCSITVARIGGKGVRMT